MSDKNLSQLITSLKTEAIEVAEKEAQNILEKANTEASRILQTANEKRNEIIEKAEKEAEEILNKGKIAFKQAGRDYSISVRNEVLQMFQTVFSDETQKAFNPDLLKNAILETIDKIDSDVELKLSSEHSKELSEFIHERLKSSEKAVSIVEDNSVLKGFIISNKNDGWSITISPDEVAEALKKQLNNNWIQILDKES